MSQATLIIYYFQCLLQRKCQCFCFPRGNTFSFSCTEMFLLLITSDCSTINKCGENSVLLFGTIATDLLSLRIRTFVILPQSTTRGKNPTPKQKRIKEVKRQIFLNWRRLCGCPSRFAGTLGGFEIGLTQTLKPFEPLGPGSANSENCSLLSKASQPEQGPALTQFFTIYLPKCGLQWMVLLGGCCLAYPASRDTCLACGKLRKNGCGQIPVCLRNELQYNV